MLVVVLLTFRVSFFRGPARRNWSRRFGRVPVGAFPRLKKSGALRVAQCFMIVQIRPSGPRSVRPDGRCRKASSGGRVGSELHPGSRGRAQNLWLRDPTSTTARTILLSNQRARCLRYAYGVNPTPRGGLQCHTEQDRGSQTAASQCQRWTPRSRPQPASQHE